jgi:hypothetical protein
MKVLRDLSPHPKGQGKAQSFPAVCHGLQKSLKPFPGGNGSGLLLIYRVDESEAVKVDGAYTRQACLRP